MKTKKPSSERPAISNYSDYRQFLKDFYEYKKATLSTPVRAYSYSAFSAAADIKSPNYLKLIIEGQRNLSEEMIKKFAKALQLSKAETEEFRVLVHYGQAQDPLERNRYLKALGDFRVNQQLKTGEIKAETWEMVPNWVTWVLYALADQKGAAFDAVRLRELMRSRVSKDEVKKSLDRLIESGQLVTDESAGVIKKGRLLMPGSADVPVAMVRKIQSELIYLGLESLFSDDSTDREFGSLTLALTEEEFEQLKFELRQLRKRIYKDILVKREQSKGDRVFQLNIQFFPVTEASPEAEPKKAADTAAKGPKQVVSDLIPAVAAALKQFDLDESEPESLPSVEPDGGSKPELEGP